jgi:hypothetical protein
MLNKIYHLRRKDENGISNQGGVTIVAKLLPNHRTVFASFAVCNGNDNFSRKIGRSIAEGRLKNGIGFKVSHRRDQKLIEDILFAKNFKLVGISRAQEETLSEALFAAGL